MLELHGAGRSNGSAAFSVADGRWQPFPSPHTDIHQQHRKSKSDPRTARIHDTYPKKQLNPGNVFDVTLSVPHLSPDCFPISSAGYRGTHNRRSSFMVDPSSD